jgi:hypothetical protein
MMNPHEPLPPSRLRAPAREHGQTPAPPAASDVDAAVQAPDEPVESERSFPTPTRTIRDGEIQGHPREMPGDRDSQ